MAKNAAEAKKPYIAQDVRRPGWFIWRDTPTLGCEVVAGPFQSEGGANEALKDIAEYGMCLERDVSHG